MFRAHLFAAAAVFFVNAVLASENRTSSVNDELSKSESATVPQPTTSTADPQPTSIVTETASHVPERPDHQFNFTDMAHELMPDETFPIRRVVTVPPGRFLVKPADNKMVVKLGDYLHVINRPLDFPHHFGQLDDFEQEKYFRSAGKFRDRFYQHHFRRKKPYRPSFGPFNNFLHEPERLDYNSYPHHENPASNLYTLTKEVKFPLLVPVEKEVTVPIKVYIDRPYPVRVIKPYPVPVQKEVPIPYKVPFPQPVPVIKKVPVPYTVQVDRPVPVPVSKPVPYFVTKKVKYPVIKHVPVQVKVPIEVPKPYPVYVNIKKNVPLSVEKPYYVPVKFKIDRPYPVSVPRPYPVVVEKPVPYAVERPYGVPVQVPVPISEAVPIPVEKHIPVYVPIKDHHSQ